MAAYSGETYASRPEAEPVTASGGTWAGVTPSRAAMSVRRFAIAASRSPSDGPRLDGALDRPS